MSTHSARWTRGGRRGARSALLGRALAAAVLAACVAAPGAALAQQGQAAPRGILPGTEFAAFQGQVLTEPQAVLGSDGRRHIAYELVLGGTTPVALKITRVQVRDAASKRTLLSLSGRRLAAHLTKMGDSEAPLKGGIVQSAETAVAWLDVSLPARARVPARLDHVVTGVVQVKGGPTLREVITPVATRRARVPALGPPLGGGGAWLASDGCCSAYTHHRWGMISVNGSLGVPQRFAIDWYAVDDQNRTWIGDPSKLTSYLSYGRPVIAAAGGVVTGITSDDFPETTSAPEPPPIPPIEQTVGNAVIIRIAPGTYILNAHMQPGSIRVRVGQRVRRGDPIGLVGSSGNSSTPHLHFQLLSTPTFFPSDSFPWAFERFELTGRMTRRIWDDDLGLQPTGTLPIVPARNAGPRRNAMPLDKDVIVLPTS